MQRTLPITIFLAVTLNLLCMQQLIFLSSLFSKIDKEVTQYYTLTIDLTEKTQEPEKPS